MTLWMFGFAIAGSVVCAVAGEWRAAAGFALGAALGILGFFLLRETASAMLGAGSAAKPRALVAKLVLRYGLMAAVIFLGHKTGWLPVLAIFAGLLVPGAGALAESLVLVREGLRTSPDLH